jgi:putative ABC transport system permease protein
MKLRDFKIGWRLLAKEPTYSSVVIVGLSIAFAACFLVLSVLLFSLSFDQHIPGVENVYIAKSHPNWYQNRAYWRENVPMPVQAMIAQSGLPVTSTRVMDLSIDVQVINPHEANQTALSQAIRVTLVDNAFPDIFGVQTVAGDLSLALTRPDALALTEETVQQLFHEKDSATVLGRSLQIAGKSHQILAVVHTPSEATSVPYAALASINSSVWNQEKRQVFSDSWDSFEGRLYLKLAADVAPEKIAQIIKAAVTASPLRTLLKPEEILDLGTHDLLEVELGKLTDSYLDDSNTSSNRSRKFDVGIIVVLGIMASLILLLAMSNFISLTIARTMARQREIAVRKVMGARGARLLAQITAEAILTAVLAAGLGLVLAWLLLPGFSYFINFKIENLLTPSTLLKGSGLAMLFAAFIGSIAGLYPAWLAIKTSPALTLNGRGNSETRHSSRLRHIVTIGQFAIGMCFASVAMTFAWQTHFARTTDRGFNPDPLLAIELKDDMTSPANQSFRDAVAQLANVTAVSVVHDMIGQTAVNRSEIKKPDGSKINLRKKLVSPEYFAVFGVQPIAGRLFDSKLDAQDNATSIVIEAAAAQALGFVTAQAAVGQFITMDGDNLQIVGITPTILLDSIVFSETTKPILYRISTKTNTMLIRTNGNIDTIKSLIQAQAAQHLPSQVLNIQPLKALLDANVKDAQMIVTVVSLATFVAMLMAAFGMYISSAISLQRKSREIVMRKLFGANPIDIAKLLGREFALLISIAAGIGLPVAYLLGRLFVEHSSKQAPIGLWPVLAAFAGAIAVTLVASYRNTAAAMRMSPALALQN